MATKEEAENLAKAIEMLAQEIEEDDRSFFKMPSISESAKAIKFPKLSHKARMAIFGAGLAAATPIKKAVNSVLGSDVASLVKNTASAGVDPIYYGLESANKEQSMRTNIFTTADDYARGGIDLTDAELDMIIETEYDKKDAAMSNSRTIQDLAGKNALLPSIWGVATNSNVVKDYPRNDYMKSVGIR